MTVGRSDWVRFPALISCVLGPFRCGDGSGGEGRSTGDEKLGGASLLHLFMTHDRL